MQGKVLQVYLINFENSNEYKPSKTGQNGKLKNAYSSTCSNNEISTSFVH